MSEIQDLLTAFKAYAGEGVYEYADAAMTYGYRLDRKLFYPAIEEYRAGLHQRMREDPEKAALYYEFLRKSYFLSARDVFDDFCIAMEWRRPAKARFYLPRRKGLLPMVKEMQRLGGDEDALDLLAISAPPGVGKTGIACFFLDWLAGRQPELGMLIGSHNGAFLRGLYDEVCRELDPEGDYAWSEIFTGHRVVKTNSLDMKIDVDKAQRFSTYQFSSVGSGNAGKVRAMGLLYCDDLIEGIEEAMSKDRLEKKWTLYTTDLKQRKQGNCKELHIATRWSVADPIGRLEIEHEGDKRAKFIRMKCFDRHGRSNFDYGGKNGFTTKFFENIRATMDEASFSALYLCEPIEREGLLYDSELVKRYFELPEGDPDCITAVCDTANGGGDYTVLCVFAKYGANHYMIDCVCSNALPQITDPMLADCLARNNVQIAQFESNNAGARTADKVDIMTREICLREGKRFPQIIKKHNNAEKATKIIVNSPFVLNNCYFKDDKILPRGSQYAKFMQQMLTFSVSGKNKHDDVPDALAEYALMSEKPAVQKVKVLRRPF